MSKQLTITDGPEERKHKKKAKKNKPFFIEWFYSGFPNLGWCLHSRYAKKEQMDEALKQLKKCNTNFQYRTGKGKRCKTKQAA